MNAVFFFNLLLETTEMLSVHLLPNYRCDAFVKQQMPTRNYAHIQKQQFDFIVNPIKIGEKL